MRILASGLLFFFCFLFSTFAVPPSPAGGGYFRIYKPGDYALASDHKDFEVSPEKTGFTIEMNIHLPFGILILKGILVPSGAMPRATGTTLPTTGRT